MTTSSPSSSSSYSYFRIPKTSSIANSVQKYRDLRLNALRISPSSFSSTLEIESSFTDEVWTSRLTQPGTEVFVCAEGTSASATKKWVGQVTLHGPKSVHEIGPPLPSTNTSSKCSSHMDHDSNREEEGGEGEGEWWQMLSLFILPEHRGKGLARRLCEEALDYLRRRYASSLYVRLMVKPENHATVHLYKQLGFVDSGRCTLAEALVANGDAEYLPPPPRDDNVAEDEVFSARTGLVLVSRLV